MANRQPQGARQRAGKLQKKKLVYNRSASKKNADWKRQIMADRKKKQEEKRKRKEEEEEDEYEEADENRKGNASYKRRKNGLGGKGQSEDSSEEEQEEINEENGGQMNSESEDEVAVSTEMAGEEPREKEDSDDEEIGDSNEGQKGEQNYGKMIYKQLQQMNKRISNLEGGGTMGIVGTTIRRSLTEAQTALVRAYVRKKIFTKTKYITTKTLKKQAWILDDVIKELKIPKERKKEYEEGIMKHVRSEMAQKRNGLMQKVKVIVKGTCMSGENTNKELFGRYRN